MKRNNVHSVSDDKLMNQLGMVTKMTINRTLLLQLKDAGRAAMDRFLAERASSASARRSTCAPWSARRAHGLTVRLRGAPRRPRLSAEPGGLLDDRATVSGIRCMHRMQRRMRACSRRFDGRSPAEPSASPASSALPSRGSPARFRSARSALRPARGPLGPRPHRRRRRPARSTPSARSSVRNPSGSRSRMPCRASVRVGKSARFSVISTSAPPAIAAASTCRSSGIRQRQPRHQVLVDRHLRLRPGRAQQRDLAPRHRLGALRQPPRRPRPFLEDARRPDRREAARRRRAEQHLAHHRREQHAGVERHPHAPSRRNSALRYGGLRQRRDAPDGPAPRRPRAGSAPPAPPAPPRAGSPRGSAPRSAAWLHEQSTRKPSGSTSAAAEPRHPLVGAEPRLERRLVRREGRRVADHDAEAPPLGGERRHRVEGVGPPQPRAARRRRPPPRPAPPSSSAARRAVDRERRASPPPPAPPARSRRRGRRRRARSARAPAAPRRHGSAAGRRRARSSAPRRGRRNRSRRSSAPRPARRARPASTAEASSSPSSARARPPAFFTTVATPVTAMQRLDQRRQPHLGPGRVRLHHRRVAEPVDHHAGQPVRLGVDQPVEGRVEERLAQRQRPAPAAPRTSRASISAAGSGSSSRTAIFEPGLNAALPSGRRSASCSSTTVPGRDRPRPPVEHDLVGIGPERGAAAGGAGRRRPQANDGTGRRDRPCADLCPLAPAVSTAASLSRRGPRLQPPAP